MPFALISPARAGSTSIRQYLDGCNEGACHGEIFGQNHIHGPSEKVCTEAVSPARRVVDPQDFHQRMFPNDSALKIGAKLLLPHFFNHKLATVTRLFVEDLDAAVMIWRRDLISRFRSEMLLRHGAGYITTDRFSVTTVDEIRADCLNQVFMAQSVMAMMGTFGIPTLVVEFEDLTGDNAAGALASMLDFLHLSHPRQVLHKDQRSKDASAKRAPSPMMEALRDSRLDRYRNLSLKDVETNVGAQLNKQI